MKASALKYTILSWVSTLIIAVLVLMPFHAFLTVWLSSLMGHYTALRLWKEVILAVCVIGTLVLFVLDHKIRTHTLTRRLAWLILAYIGLTIVWGVIAYTGDEVTAKALGYGLIVDLRFPIFFLVCWSVALRLGRLRQYWQGIVIWPALVVVIFGILQIFIFPHDFLRHFGYGPNTILPVETINSNSHYHRIFSTLRGPNPFGEYLIIPISVVTVLLYKAKRSWRDTLLYIGLLIVLLYSFSRSAWIGASLSVLSIVLIKTKSKKAKKSLGIIAASAVLIMLATFGIFHNNSHFENLIYHTDSSSAIKTTSDQGHLAKLKDGLSNVAHSPLGNGPGSAGPASVYNTGHPVRIAENFYIQIGQEMGWLGLFLFLLINLGVGYLLWIRRSDPLALSLFASLIGISFVNLFLHGWADDTVAYLWWGLAGIAMAPIAKAADEEKE
jgi:hypothetical protein